MTGNPSLQIEGTSYSVDELYKTQPDSFTDRSRINSMKEIIKTIGPDAVPPILVRVHNGQAMIVDGHHRFKAFVELGYDRVPIRYISENQISSQFGRTLQDLLNMKFK